MLGSVCRKVLYLPPFDRAYSLPMSSSVTGIKHVWKFSPRGRISWSQIACRALKSCWLVRAFGPLPSWNQRALAQVCTLEQVCFSLTAPIVWLGFVGCSEPWQPGADSGNACGVTHSAPQTNPLPEGGTHPSLI